MVRVVVRVVIRVVLGLGLGLWLGLGLYIQIYISAGRTGTTSYHRRLYLYLYLAGKAQTDLI